MSEQRNRVVRQLVRQTLRGVTKLQSMNLNYVQRGKADLRGKELTRAEFFATFAQEADRMRSQLKALLNAVILS